jgi:hypothetical protein
MRLRVCGRVLFQICGSLKLRPRRAALCRHGLGLLGSAIDRERGMPAANHRASFLSREALNRRKASVLARSPGQAARFVHVGQTLAVVLATEGSESGRLTQPGGCGCSSARVRQKAITPDKRDNAHR